MEALCRAAGRPVESTHVNDRNQNELLAMAYRMIANLELISKGPEFAEVLSVVGDSSQSTSTER
jgi:hypothetical protein